MIQNDSKEVFENLIDELEKLLRTPCTAKADDPLFNETPLSEEEDKQNPGQRRVTRKRYRVSTSNGQLYIDNWKFREFDYSKRADKMPCLARGLFTTPSGIVVRGYDKFFNVDELPSVKRDILREECTGPFNASSKENGCIMFFSGLSDGTLLVCSKNVTGDVNPNPQGKLKHYERGMADIQSQLEKIGKTKLDLARVLHSQNLTAVAELCDDSYEEHVVPYPPERAGLYLHGLNYNTKEFKTLHMDTVADFADTWGFRKVQYTSYDTFDAVMDYASQIENQGKYADQEIEGIVVRCKRGGKDYFFKYKIAQPYFLYRQFREATLKLFCNDNKRNVREVLALYPDFKRVTLAYLEFAEAYFKEHPEEIKNYENNIGIIKVRQEFLKSLGYGEDQGMKLIEMNTNESLAAKLEKLLETTKTVYCLSTIAVPGCGKTTTCMILNFLFPEWKHFQNDDYPNAKSFYTAISENFVDTPVVMLDRVNYRMKYRQEAFESLSKFKAQSAPDVEIKHVGLNFLNLNKIAAEAIAKQRIIDRGDNHQSLKAKTHESTAISLLNSNLANFEGPKLKSGESELPVSVKGSELQGADSTYSLVINMEVSSVDSSLENAKIIYRELSKFYPTLNKGVISEERWQAALNAAKSYTPKFTKNVVVPSRKPIYYAIHADGGIFLPQIEEILKENSTWQLIKRNKRIQDHFHMTISHLMSKRSNPNNGEIWTQLGREFAVNQKKKITNSQKGQNVLADIKVEKIVVIENTLVVLKVRVTKYYKERDGNITPYQLALPTTNKHLHITIGTRTEAIKPRESNSYLITLYDQCDLSSGEHRLENFIAQVYDCDIDLEKQEGFIHWQEY